MPVNPDSGRVVVVIDAELKRALHSVLAARGITMKEWFVRNAVATIDQHAQPAVSFAAEPRQSYEAHKWKE